jgi:hypothetical protein
MDSDNWILEWDIEHSKQFLFDLIINNSINYKLLNKKIFLFSDQKIEYDLTFVIPIRNRKKMLNTFIKYFKKMLVPKKININLIVIEQGKKSINKKTCISEKIDYIFIKDNEVFNKCLCYNIGVLFGNASNNYIFHDVDILMDDNFLINLYKNLNVKDTKNIQTFNNSLIDLSKGLSKQVVNEDIKLSNLKKIKFKLGPGGSIHISKETFFSVGGFDDNLFKGWGYEDEFFWSKIDVVSKMNKVDSPIIFLYHLYHKKFWLNDINLRNNNKLIFKIWKNYFTTEDKLNSIEIFKKKFNYE